MQKLIPLFLVSALLLCACGATGQSRSEKLKEAIFYFNEGVRWGRLQDVMTRVDPGGQELFLEMHKDFGKLIKVTGYEIVNTAYDTENHKAQVGVKITWYRIDQMEVHETVVSQNWEDRDHTWVLIAEEYMTGTPFN